MAHEYTLFSQSTHYRPICTRAALVPTRKRSFAAAATAACTERLQLVAKVRALPNNGFPHEEQIGRAIYLSGAPANVCILTREPPEIFNLRAHHRD